MHRSIAGLISLGYGRTLSRPDTVHLLSDILYQEQYWSTSALPAPCSVPWLFSTSNKRAKGLHLWLSHPSSTTQLFLHPL